MSIQQERQAGGNAKLLACISILACLLGTTACVQTQPQVLLAQDTQDGGQAYAVKCSNSAYGIGHCYEQAKALCGTHGFNILSRKENIDNMQSMNISCR